MQQAGKYMMIAGIAILLIGIIVYFWGNKFQWFGNLPGDIKINKEHFKFYAPITSMLVLSAVITLVLWIINRLR